MLVKELIDKLKEFNPDSTVLVWDPQSWSWETVSGFVYDKDEVQIFSDDTQ